MGWSVLGTAVLAWLLARWTGWNELQVAAYGAALLFALCCLLMIGRAELVVGLWTRPSRIRVGELAEGMIDVRNVRRGLLTALLVEVPVASTVNQFHLPVLRAGSSHREEFTIPAARRGVITVGPATTVRGDPLGLLRRTVRWTGVEEVFVHPEMVSIEPIDAGILRDLEGQTTQDLSASDLAFHALRDYVPGDDRRHIHWKSSAKAGAGVPGGKFLVRQFLDTRRSHLSVVVDGDLASYPDAAHFETALSVGASVAARAIRDEIDTTMLAADQVVNQGTVQRTLDGFSRAELDLTPLPQLAAHAARVAPTTSVALLITGAATDVADLRRAAAIFPLEVSTVVVRVAPAEPSGLAHIGDLRVLNLSALSDLPGLLRAGREW